MDLKIYSVPFSASKWEVTRAIAAVVHSEGFDPSGDARKPNFEVYLSNGSGFLTFETAFIGRKFLAHVSNSPIRMGGMILKFKEREMTLKSLELAEKLRKTPYVDAEIVENRAGKIYALDHDLLLQTVQFGFLHYPSEKGSLVFSEEWENTSAGNCVRLDYDRQAFEVKVSIQYRLCFHISHPHRSVSWETC